MVRNAWIAAAVTALLAAALTAAAGPGDAIAAPGATGAVALQTEQAAAAVALRRGEVFEGPGFDVLVDDVVTAEAGLGSTAVRVGIVVTNRDAVTAFSPLLFLSPTSPRFVLRDAGGAEHAVDGHHPLSGSRPGSTLIDLEPGMSARWTIGFSVPTARDEALELELRSGAVPLARWDLDTGATPPPVEPPALETVILGDEIAWSDTLRVSPRAFGTYVCGDPTIETVTQIVTVTFDVTNTGGDDARWPGVAWPDTPATLLWSDGTSARTAHESFVGDSEPLTRLDGGTVVVPAATSFTRALVFGAPRDGRLTDVATSPEGAVLRRPDGSRLWLDFGGATPTVGIPDAWCDLGFLGAPVPFAFGPGPKYDVLGEQVSPLTPVELEKKATELLQRTLTTVARYYDANGASLDGLDRDTLAALAPDLVFLPFDETNPPDTAREVVVFSVIDADRIFVMTESANGIWHCTTAAAFETPTFHTGTDAEEAAAACLPAEETDTGDGGS